MTPVELKPSLGKLRQLFPEQCRVRVPPDSRFSPDLSVPCCGRERERPQKPLWLFPIMTRNKFLYKITCTKRIREESPLKKSYLYFWHPVWPIYPLAIKPCLLYLSISCKSQISYSTTCHFPQIDIHKIASSCYIRILLFSVLYI